MPIRQSELHTTMTTVFQSNRVISFFAAITICMSLIGFGCRTPQNQQSSQTITVASFNTLHLGWNNQKDLIRFAHTVALFDIVALQEVMNEDTLKRVISLLESETKTPWAYIISSEKIGRTSYKEFYAVVYRTDRIEFVQGSAGIWKDDGDKFEREPFFATFRSGNFDFTLLVMHSKFDGKKEVMRKEAASLADVFVSIQESDPNEQDIILLGDFNLAPSDTGWQQMRLIPTATHLLSDTVKTTIGTSGSLANSYDNIWIQMKYTRWEYSGTAQAQHEVFRLFESSPNPVLDVRKYISDHLPIYAVFYTGRSDDD